MFYKTCFSWQWTGQCFPLYCSVLIQIIFFFLLVSYVESLFEKSFYFFHFISFIFPGIIPLRYKSTRESWPKFILMYQHFFILNSHFSFLITIVKIMDSIYGTQFSYFIWIAFFGKGHRTFLPWVWFWVYLYGRGYTTQMVYQLQLTFPENVLCIGYFISDSINKRIQWQSPANTEAKTTGKGTPLFFCHGPEAQECKRAQWQGLCKL